MSNIQMQTDAANASFWNELCGSAAARAWGITDNSAESLRRYDSNYFSFYPYLERRIGWAQMRGQRVLEVGLGYGSVSQKIFESGADFTGLDIAANPVLMANHRLSLANIPGKAIQGSILDSPFPAESFDAIVAVGCLHHTGNLAGAIAACRRLLRPGGRLIGMVYYAYSYRQLRVELRRAASYWLREIGGFRGTVRDGETGSYDRSKDGALAPVTEFVSVKSLQSLCSQFEKFHAETENVDQEPPFSFCRRAQLLKSPVPRLCGLDVYWTCNKPL